MRERLELFKNKPDRLNEQPNYLEDADLFREFAASTSAEAVERVVIAQQSQRMNGRAPGKYRIILLTVRPFSSINTQYHTGRAFDDIADGDTELPERLNGFPDYVGYLKQKVANQDFTVDIGGYSEFLLYRSIGNLLRKTDDSDVANGVNAFLDSMQQEYERRVNKIILPRRELYELYRKSFGSSYDIALIELGSKIRANDIPEILVAQGRLYALKDLKKDLHMGICNIPKEVLDISGLGWEQLQNADEIRENRILNNWAIEEVNQCSDLLDNFSYKGLDLKAKAVVFYFKTGLGWDVDYFEKRIREGRSLLVDFEHKKQV